MCDCDLSPCDCCYFCHEDPCVCEVFTYTCQHCDITLNSQKQFDQHCEGKRHKKQVEKFWHTCGKCGTYIPDCLELLRHECN